MFASVNQSLQNKSEFKLITSPKSPLYAPLHISLKQREREGRVAKSQNFHSHGPHV